MKDQDLMTHSEEQVTNNLEEQKSTSTPEETVIEVPAEETNAEIPELSIESENTDSKQEPIVLSTEKESDKTPDVDFSSMTKHELVTLLSETISEEYNNSVKEKVEVIRSVFYTKHKEDQSAILKKYLADGGIEEDFDLGKNDLEVQMKSLLKEFREKKHIFSKKIESEKEDNLKKKYEVIESIKNLSQSDEATGNPFNKFKELQKQWFNIGMVPQSSLKHMWDSYHHNVEQFYDFVKINDELKQLDFKRNLDAKTLLCENTEALSKESSIIKAFNLLQDFHDQWREIGPVERELKESLWLRFKAATTYINKKHQDHYEGVKTKQRENLAAKAELCAQVEEIASRDFEEHKEWNKASKNIIEIQDLWRNIGFAPKKENDQIYKRFRTACDEFFTRKREYYLQLKDVLNVNMDQKIELCLKAESLCDSTDWKRTTDELIAIQKQWKEIGAVPRKDSDVVWLRFRSACDSFFNNKTDHYKSLESEYETNLVLKKELITKLENYIITDNFSTDLENLKQFQQEWNNIGHVPFAGKDKIIKEFRNLINAFYDKLKTDVASKELERFKSKIDSYKSNSRTDDKIISEKNKMQVKLKQMEADIIVWENNLGFFSNSKSADSLIADFKKKIEKAKENAIFLKEKIKLIDQIS